MEKKKPKLYVSLPISGHDYDEVYARCAAAIAKYSDRYQVVTPVELVRDTNTPYNECMAICIRELLTCDAAVFLDGWRDSKGCFLEYWTCRIYNIYNIEDNEL